jgi:hypothetical protein
MNRPNSSSGKDWPAVACDLTAISSEDRTRYKVLRVRLADSLLSAKELQSGLLSSSA